MLEYNVLEVTLEIRGQKDSNILIMESEMSHNTLFLPSMCVVTRGFIIYICRLCFPFTHCEVLVEWVSFSLIHF